MSAAAVSQAGGIYFYGSTLETRCEHNNAWNLIDHMMDVWDGAGNFMGQRNVAVEGAQAVDKLAVSW